MEASQLKPSLSRDENKRGLGEDFPGHAHESEVVPLRTFDIHRESGITWDDQYPT